MATKTWKIEKDLCRCCHAEGTFDNLAEPRTFLEKEEIYSDMLRECLDVDIPPVPGELCAITYTICNACITRLRDACNFKKQVQDCEQRFMTLYYKNAIQSINTETRVKEELEMSLEDNHSDEDVEAIVLKKEEEEDDDSLMDRDDDDDDDMSEDFPIKKPTTSMKTRQKPKAKTKPPPVKKEKPQPQTRKKAEPKPVKEKKGGKLAKGFFLKREDYRKDGERLICGHCDKSYTLKGSLTDHIRRIHYKIPSFSCPICDEEFMTEPPLTIHKLQQHNVDDRYHCNGCKKMFNSKQYLCKHVKSYHLLGRRRKCPKCEYESYSLANMKKHMFRHKTERDYKCRFCKKTFVRRGTMLLHERIHTGDKRKVCQICGQAFVQKASLNYHMTKYHPEVNY